MKRDKKEITHSYVITLFLLYYGDHEHTTDYFRKLKIAIYSSYSVFIQFILKF